MGWTVAYEIDCNMKEITEKISRLNQKFSKAFIGIDPTYKMFVIKNEEENVSVFEIDPKSEGQYFEMDIDLVHPAYLLNQIYVLLLADCNVKLRDKITQYDIGPTELYKVALTNLAKCGHNIVPEKTSEAARIFYGE